MSIRCRLSFVNVRFVLFAHTAFSLLFSVACPDVEYRCSQDSSFAHHASYSRGSPDVPLLRVQLQARAAANKIGRWTRGFLIERRRCRAFERRQRQRAAQYRKKFNAISEVFTFEDVRRCDTIANFIRNDGSCRCCCCRVDRYLPHRTSPMSINSVAKSVASTRSQDRIDTKCGYKSAHHP